jgi:hypothetical protein
MATIVVAISFTSCQSCSESGKRALIKEQSEQQSTTRAERIIYLVEIGRSGELIEVEGYDLFEVGAMVDIIKSSTTHELTVARHISDRREYADIAIIYKKYPSRKAKSETTKAKQDIGINAVPLVDNPNKGQHY